MELRVALTRRATEAVLSRAGTLLHRSLERCVQAARADGLGWFNAADDVSLLAAAAAIEALSRRQLTGRPIRDAQRVLVELITKLLR